MFLPVKHPEHLHFRLSRIGTDPSNDTEVVCGYGCLRLLARVFPEATEAFDQFGIAGLLCNFRQISC